MRQALKLAFILFLLLAIVSCAKKYMIQQSPMAVPGQGKALVNFMRPSFFGKAVSVSLWDGDKLIGKIYGQQAFQYECEPGKHLFIAWSEYKSPVEAELLPDHAYYIVLRTRMGGWRARIHQVPINKNHELWQEAQQWRQSLPNFTFDPAMISAMEAESRTKINEYMQYYEREVKGTKHVLYLRPEDGELIE
jgi:hypothetical protein